MSIRRAIVRPLMAASVLLALAACEPTGLLVTGASMATVVVTNKTLTDHAISAALDRDCSTVRASRGESFCKSDPAPTMATHCYRTLGSVNCYRRPDPKASDQAQVGDGPDRPPVASGWDFTERDVPSLDLTGVFGDTAVATQN